MRWWLLIALAGCAGDSGVKRGKALGDLTDAEWQRLCEWAVDAQGGPGVETDCGDGVIVTSPTVDQCVDGATSYGGCAEDVRAFERCATALGEDPCTGFASEACEVVFACEAR